ncbi:MAG: hypothetical protein L6R28_23760 [Planctomycetes bacterium]|nr:hypothetical protein [Planctomycetota bacterium]
MRHFVAVLLLAGAATAPFAADLNLPEMAYTIATKDLTAEGWEAWLRDADKNFETWSVQKQSTNRERFLNDKLMDIFPRARSGDVTALKRFIYWLALYKQYQFDAPWFIRLVARRHGDDFKDLLENFSWERFAEKVKGADQTPATPPSTDPPAPILTSAPAVDDACPDEASCAGEADAAGFAAAEAREPDVETAPAIGPRHTVDPGAGIELNDAIWVIEIATGDGSISVIPASAQDRAEPAPPSRARSAASVSPTPALTTQPAP